MTNNTIAKLLFGESHVHGYAPGKFKPSKQEYIAIVLSGGGIDSFASALAYKQMVLNQHAYLDLDHDDGDTGSIKFKFYFVCFNYGQQTFEAEHSMTVQQAEYFTMKHKVECQIMRVDDPMKDILANPLANREEQREQAMLQARNYNQNDDYVPNRNARFVFMAAGLAEKLAADAIILGAVGNVNQDNSLAFIESAAETIRQSNRDYFPAIYAPFVLMSKSVVPLYLQQAEFDLRTIPHMTTSCFDNNIVTDLSRKEDAKYIVIQCGVCRSCSSLKQAFKFAAVDDPYLYDNDPKSFEGKSFTIGRGSKSAYQFIKDREDRIKNPPKKVVDANDERLHTDSYGYLADGEYRRKLPKSRKPSSNDGTPTQRT